MKLLRTNSTNPEFRELVGRLDADLAERDGEEHAFYHQYNGLEGLDRAVVYYLEGQAVGCGALKVFDPNAVEIKRMFTDPEYRGKGIAAGVLKELELWAAADGFTRMVLETGLRNPEAIGLYEKYGYRRIPNFEPYVGVANSVCFEKRL
ncbi:Acetyltransferase (GNAT) family protein [Robiginitalea myxolifaciens]|uniref:Acetyltransferase (GNAT) family protein n=1 Tax=Robiginitalea myxolifaciens TaxID=400055 RepID=A0A1I6HGT5_9FLAO|nr:GNAT family N-acetyltransferase [Robiginitalea myxolifaciens]SFR53510.1 Acetyltransferase (GNAT) family protein [Robiginitalea myxolifaciens]